MSHESGASGSQETGDKSSFLQRIMEQDHGTSVFHLTETLERPRCEGELSIY